MKAAIFDMDGVLIDSEPLHYESDLVMLKKMNIRVDDANLNNYVGVRISKMWDDFKKKFKLKMDLEEIVEMHQGIKDELLAKGNYRPIDGVEGLLAGLKDGGVPVAIASSSSREFIEAVVGKIGIGQYIDVFVSGDEVARSKPEPDIFLEAAARLKVAPPDCVVIEDSRNGILAAREAKMKSVGFKNANSGDQDLSAATAVVESMKAIDLRMLNAL